MADKFTNIMDNVGAIYPQRLKDNTDGTFSPEVIVEPLGQPTVARQVTVTTSSTNTQLTATVTRISIKARTADQRYAIGTTSQTASATTSHFIEAGERLDISVPAGAHIAFIRDTGATADGKLEITELG
jgi:hypothetical protein